MRKVTRNIIFGMAIFSFCISSVFAGDLSLTAGIKGWANELTIGISNPFIDIDDMNGRHLLGVSLKLSYGNFFGGISWLQVTEDYSIRYRNNTISPPATGHVKFNRRDVDILAGYMLHPRFGIIAGYKLISSDDAIGVLNDKFDLSITGYAIGVTANYPFGESPLLLYTNLSFMPSMEYSFYVSQPDYKQDMDGFSLEIGLSYDILKRAAFSLGFKFQDFSSDRGEDWEWWGLTFSIDSRF